MFSLIPREMAFFDSLEAGARNALTAARKLRDMCENFKDAEAQFQVIRELEHEGDRITHDFLDRLDRTFVVPLDREDLYALARGIDDIVDQIDLVADHMVLYGIDAPTKLASAMVRVLVRCCEELDVSMPLLRSKRRIREVNGHCIEIDRLENLGDELNRESLMALFDNPTDAITVLKWKEFYSVLEDAIDATDAVADLLRGIVIKAI